MNKLTTVMLEAHRHSIFEKLSGYDILSQESLFHYTNNEAFLGIISNKELWATNALHLNDPEELNYAIALAKAISNESKEKYRGESSEVFNDLLSTIEDLLDYHDIYVISFSENSDKLSQWRGYGRQYKSISFGLSFDSLKNEVSEQGNFCFLEKVIYDPDLQKKILREYIEGAIKIVYNKELNDVLLDAMKVILVGLVRILIRFKHPCWVEENEWRITLLNKESFDFKIGKATGDREIFYRAGDTCLIPFVKFRFSEAGNLMTSVIVPHHVNSSKNIKAISAFMKKNNFDTSGVSIIESNIRINY